MTEDRIYQKKDGDDKVWMDVNHKTAYIIAKKDNPIIGDIVNYVTSHHHTLKSSTSPMSDTETAIKLSFLEVLALNKNSILDQIETHCLQDYQCTQKPSLAGKQNAL